MSFYEVLFLVVDRKIFFKCEFLVLGSGFRGGRERNRVLDVLIFSVLFVFRLGF